MVVAEGVHLLPVVDDMVRCFGSLLLQVCHNCDSFCHHRCAC